MKIFVTAVGLIFATVIYGQQCKCATDTLLRNIVSCETIHFKNHSKLYWQFNCDSSWLTFKSRSGVKTILFSLGGSLQIYTERLGYSYATEYISTFLIRNNLISGCCTPPEYHLFNKANGKEIKNLGSLIFYSENSKYPLVVYIEKKTLNKLKFYDINTRKSFSVSLPKNKIANTLANGFGIYPEYLFDEPAISNNHFSISFRYQDLGKKDDWHEYKVVVDLKKYGYN